MIVNKLVNVGDTIIGRVVGMGLRESNNEPRYMLIEGVDNKIYYVLATESMTKKRDGGDLRNGEIIYLERRDKYIFAESFSGFDSILQNKRLSNLDMYLLKNVQEMGQLPAGDVNDGKVRQVFLDIMEERVKVM